MSGVISSLHLLLAGEGVALAKPWGQTLEELKARQALLATPPSFDRLQVGQ